MGFEPLHYCFFSGKNILVETDVGRRGLWACSSIQSNEITYNWYMKRSCSFSICLHFATVCLFYENFWVEKKISDIIQTFHRDWLEKTLYWIGNTSYLYEHEMFGWCQTRSIFSICFLLLYNVMAPKIFEKEKWHFNSSTNQNLTHTQQRKTMSTILSQSSQY